MIKVFVLTLVSLAFVASINAQTTVDAVRAKIELTPTKVYVESVKYYFYLAQTEKNQYVIFISKDQSLQDTLIKKSNDTIAILEGAIFKPLQHFTKKQWRKLSKEIKLYFSQVAQKELEAMSFYLVFNYGFEPKKKQNSTLKPAPVVINPNTNSGTGGNDGP